MEQQNSNTTPQGQQQDPYDPRTNGQPYHMPPGVYDSRRGTYMREEQQIFHLMLDERVMLDLVDNMPAALKEWTIKSPLKSDNIDMAIMLQKRAELPKEIQDRLNETYDRYKEINETYKIILTKYKEAVLLLHDELQLQNKDLTQIIILYYFVTRDISVFERTPLTDEQRADLIATAQEMDKVYTNSPTVKQKYYLDPEYTDLPQEFTEAREFFAYFPFISHYCCYKEFADLPIDDVWKEEPQQLMLPCMKTYKAKTYIIPNNTLINDMEQRPRINYGPYDLPVFGDITTYVAISYEPDPESGITAKGPEKLSPYLRMLSNAVVSLFVAGKEKGQDKPIISDEMIYRTMPGAGEKLSRGQKAALTKAIDKLRSMYMVIDATNELRNKKKIGPNETYRIDSNYLMVTRAEYKLQNGRITHAYRIEAEPPIYTYALAVKQLCSIPTKYLDIRQVENGLITDKPVRMTQEKQVITDILLRRIALMKYDARNKKPKQSNDAQPKATQNKKRTRRRDLRNEIQRQSHNILFSTLFETAGLTDLTAHQKKVYRDFVFEVLKFETAAGYIKGYKEQKENNWEIKGVEIIL